MTEADALDTVSKMASITLAQLDATKRLQEVEDAKPSTRRAWIVAVSSAILAGAAIFTSVGTILGLYLGKHL
jgi:hypothetical protein